jgi:hypothetical protein
MDESDKLDSGAAWELFPYDFYPMPDEFEVILLYNGGFLYRQQAFIRPASHECDERCKSDMHSPCTL